LRVPTLPRGGFNVSAADGAAEAGVVATWDGLRLEVEEVEDGRAVRVLVTKAEG